MLPKEYILEKAKYYHLSSCLNCAPPCTPSTLWCDDADIRVYGDLFWLREHSLTLLLSVLTEAFGLIYTLYISVSRWKPEKQGCGICSSLQSVDSASWIMPTLQKKLDVASLPLKSLTARLLVNIKKKMVSDFEIIQTCLVPLYNELVSSAAFLKTWS